MPRCPQCGRRPESIGSGMCLKCGTPLPVDHFDALVELLNEVDEADNDRQTGYAGTRRETES